MRIHDERNNIIIVPTEQESAEDIIEEYAEGAMDCRNIQEMRLLMMGLYNELTVRIAKDYHIDQALNALETLEDIQEEIDVMKGDLDDEDLD